MTSSDRRTDEYPGTDLAFEEGEVLRLILNRDRGQVTAAKRASPTNPVEADRPTAPGAKEARNA
jgi:hypothetical protein